MTYSEIHSKIKKILANKMRVFRTSASYTANFYDDFGLSSWELNWLLYNVEDHFNITLEKGLENRISTINQLVSLIYAEQQRKYSGKVVA